MNMNSYLIDMKNAVEPLIGLVWKDHAAVKSAEAKLRKLEQETRRGYERAQSFANDDDDDGLGTAIYWETYFGADKERFQAQENLDDLQASVAVYDFSRSALSSALLQYGKQGISIAHRNFSNAPLSRQVHGVELRDLIWQGRNHALHWEDGNPHPPVRACFDQLKQAEPVFGDYTIRNMAFEVVQLLGWKDWASFEADMKSLA